MSARFFALGVLAAGFLSSLLMAQPGGAVPSELTLPAGTLITVRSNQLVSSDRNRPGDAFTTVLEQPLVVQGWVVAQRGQIGVGRVLDVREAGRIRGVAELAVELTELMLLDGQQIPIRTQFMQGSGDTSRGRDVEVVGTTTGIGAAVGGAADGGRGAAIGAAIGAAAGLAGVLSTRGRPAEIRPETLLTFRLEFPVTVSTRQAPHAFRPVSPEDYQARGVFRLPSSRPRDSSRGRPHIGIGVGIGYPRFYRAPVFPTFYYGYSGFRGGRYRSWRTGWHFVYRGGGRGHGHGSGRGRHR